VLTALIIWHLFFLTLLTLSGVSIYLAFSGYLPGRTYIGWTFLGFYVTIFLAFAIFWLRPMQNPFMQFFAALLLGLLLATQGPLVVELISQAVMPDPSKGLKLIKVYTEAEKRVVQDDLPGAIEEYEKVIAEDPDDVTARFRLAELCYQNEEYRKAAMAYEALLAREKGLDVNRHCSALTRLSEIYAQHLGDTKSARKHVQTIIDKYPGTKYAGYAMDWLENL
jgi:tetratricopeptide (TPR) repeat protein